MRYIRKNPISHWLSDSKDRVGISQIGHIPSRNYIEHRRDECVVRAGVDDDRSEVEEHRDTALVAVDERRNKRYIDRERGEL